MERLGLIRYVAKYKIWLSYKRNVSDNPLPYVSYTQRYNKSPKTNFSDIIFYLRISCDIYMNLVRFNIYLKRITSLLSSFDFKTNHIYE